MHTIEKETIANINELEYFIMNSMTILPQELIIWAR